MFAPPPSCLSGSGRRGRQCWSEPSGTAAALHVIVDGRHWHRRGRAGVDDGRGIAGGVGERVDSGSVEEHMDEEHCPEGTGDGPEQRAGATGSTGTGFEVGEVAGEVVSVVAVGASWGALR